MICPSCGTELPERAKFCLECGAALGAATGPTVRLPDSGDGPRCPTCDMASPPGALFCINCGQSLGAPDAAPASGPGDPGPAPIPPAGPAADRREARRRARAARRSARRMARTARRGPCSRAAAWGSVGGGVFLIGLGLLFLTGAFWPGIIALIGITGFLSNLAAGQPRNALQSLLWFGGLTIMFKTGFWPGMVIAVGLSAIVGSD